MMVRQKYLLLMVFVLVKFSQSVPIGTTTQQLITSRPHKDCFPSGFEFAYDDVIDHGNFPNSQTCWRITCGSSGRLIKSLTPCEKVATHKKPTPKPIENEKKEKVECVFNGKAFEPGEDIQTLSDWQTDRCYGTRCNKHGNIVAWENINCYSTPYYSTTEKSDVQTTMFSTPPSQAELSTTEASGCYENSVIYQPGEEISYQYFTENQTCCGRYCNYNNKIVSWKRSECEQGTSTVEPTSTTFITESSTTDPSHGCLANGKAFKPGKHIDSGNDGSSWCFGRYCNEHSVIVYWDDFNCDVTSSRTPSLITSNHDVTKAPTTSDYDITKAPTASDYDVTKAPTASDYDVTKSDLTTDVNLVSSTISKTIPTTDDKTATEISPPVVGSIWEQLQFLMKNNLYATVVETDAVKKIKNGKYQVKLSIFKRKL